MAEEKKESMSAADEEDETWGDWMPQPVQSKEEEAEVPARAGPWLGFEWKWVAGSKREQWAQQRNAWRKKRGGMSKTYFENKYHRDFGPNHS